MTTSLLSQKVDMQTLSDIAFVMVIYALALAALFYVAGVIGSHK